jgi:hypothetical protein
MATGGAAVGRGAGVRAALAASDGGGMATGGAAVGAGIAAGRAAFGPRSCKPAIPAALCPTVAFPLIGAMPGWEDRAPAAAGPIAGGDDAFAAAMASKAGAIEAAIGAGVEDGELAAVTGRGGFMRGIYFSY